jgi:predicted dehydrogenase
MASSRRVVTRRGFLATAAAGIVAPYVLTSEALGAEGAKPASDRIVIATIGVGGQGSGHLGIRGDARVRYAAVCDVDDAHLANALKAVGGACQGTKDFRQILDRKDIDAVTIATPDHWHALITLLACQAGKDVYCEKPLSRSVVEGRRMVEAARRFGRVVQMGTQHRSRGVIRQACEWVRNNRLGKPEKVRLWVWKNRYQAVQPRSPCRRASTTRCGSAPPPGRPTTPPAATSTSAGSWTTPAAT